MERYGTLIWLALLAAFFYFMIIRPEKKKQKQAKDMMDGLHVGDEIMTRGGIYGKVTLINDDVITIATGPDNVQINMSRFSLATVTKKAENSVAGDTVETAADEIKDDKNE